MSSNLFQLLSGTKIVLNLSQGFVLVDTLTLGRALGYKDISRLRRQIVTEWNRKGFFETPKDFVSVAWRGAQEQQEYLKIAGFRREPVELTRDGAVFLTKQGMLRLFERTTKPAKATVEVAWGVWLDSQLDSPSRPPETSEIPEAELLVPLEERRFRHEVMRGLFRDLLATEAPWSMQSVFRRFAIEIAESALGESLPEPRERFLPKQPEAVVAVVPEAQDPTPRRPTTIAPVLLTPTSSTLFMRDGYYTLTEIGEKAGGYSATVAGLAANTVAAAQGVSAAQLRTQRLGFNQLKTAKIKGHERVVVKFNRDFSNKVVVELKRNPKFTPRPTKAVVRVTGFEDSGGHIDLSSPPLSSSDF